MYTPSQSNTPVLEALSRWDAVVDEGARAATERVLPTFIATRRWYRTKTKAIVGAKIVAAFPLVYPSVAGTEIARILLVEVALDDGAKATYVVPLAFVSGESAAKLAKARPDAIVAPLRVTVGADPRARGGRATVDGLMVDALVLEEVAFELLANLGRGAVIEDAGLVLRFTPIGGARKSLASEPPPDVHSLRFAGEQSNTSLIYGDRFVGKVIRKIDVGATPDVELGRALAEAGFAHTPPLVGTFDVSPAEPKDAAWTGSTIGLLHRFVPNRGDAWEHVLGVLDRWLGTVAHRDSSPPRLPAGDLMTLARSPIPAPIADAVGDYVGASELLGRRVGEMHVALATARKSDPSFAPEPMDGSATLPIVAAVSEGIASALRMLDERRSTSSPSTNALVDGIRANESRLAARLAHFAKGDVAGGIRQRVHGDLHLGQVLFTGADFAIIDFEGEPARTLDERRAKRSPMVDVAGMLRSFHYAAVSALRKAESRGGNYRGWATLWQRVVSASFLRGWLEAVAGTIVVPADPKVTLGLVDLFLLEKVAYEVVYEMNNRPDWVEIPLQGLLDLVVEIAPAPAGAPVAAPTAAAPVPAGLIAAGGRSAEPVAIDSRSPAVLAFFEGRATHAQALLGAHVRTADATDFVVWAPNANAVAVIGDWNEWTGEDAYLHALPGGLFAGRVRGATWGHRYKYRIHRDVDGIDVVHDKADPFAYGAEIAPRTASVITPLDYTWGDDAWTAERRHAAQLDRPLSIYEVHLGSWRRVVEDGGRSLTYREIAKPLADHVRAMGFTHVELMPVLEHPYDGSWGYGVTGFFAATSRFGTPADLMFLVDTLHQAGIGVIFDWVPAHFVRDGHGLAMFDGGPTFEPADPARAIHPTWRTGRFDFARPEVRSFLVSSATFFIEAFHLDGLRVDGVESILYEDHGRDGGGATPSQEGLAFLRALTSTLKMEHPDVLLVAEDSSAWPGVTRAQIAGGLGFDLKWDMGFSHDMRRYLAVDPIHRSHHHAALTFRSVYAGNEAFVVPLSHDDVADGRGGSLLAQMHGDPWQRFANLRMLYALAWAEPGKKLLFMGDEWAQWESWRHDRSLDWHLFAEGPHGAVARLVGDLNRLYRETPALHVGDASSTGFAWIDGTNAPMSVVTFLRQGPTEESLVVVACNFTPVPRHQYRIGVPRAGTYREILNTDASTYGGSGQGNMGGVSAVPYPWNGRPNSIVVTLPPLAVCWFALSLS